MTEPGAGPRPAPAAPPEGETLPARELPLESEAQRRQRVLLVDSLNEHWSSRSDFYCGGQMGVYFSAAQVATHEVPTLDVFVVQDATRRARNAWVVWEEGGLTPDVVIDLRGGEGTAEDRARRQRICERRLKVGDYLRFDPETQALEAFRLHGGRYTPVDLDAGRAVVPALGLSLGIHDAPLNGAARSALRWFDGGQPVLREAERPSFKDRLAAYERRFGKLEE